MRPEQYERLQALQEKLTDVVIQEADPERWPGNGKELAELTRDERGDRYWCKRNAAATLSVIMRVQNLVHVVEQRSSRRPNEGEAADDLEDDVLAAEREAAAILAKMQRKARER